MTGAPRVEARPDQYGPHMSLADILRSAAEREFRDPDGGAIRFELTPGLDDDRIARVQARYRVPLPAQLVDAMRVTAGAEQLLGLDLTGESHSVEADPLLPAGHPIAGDGFGNFWLLDLTPDTTETAPVFFLCHDPPLLLYQAPDLESFVAAALGRLEPPHRSVLDEVREDRPFNVWGTRPGVLSREAALNSTDVALQEFARVLDDAWTIVDLRRREIGMGVAWGRYGPRTRLARHGWERIFGYAPYAPAKRRWWRLGRRTTH